MRVVVTGATGNVGAMLMRRLSEDPAVDEIEGVARRPARGWELAKVRWTGLDVGRDPLGSVFAGADAVVHLAWAIQPSRDRSQTLRTNVEGSARVFDAALRAGVGSILYASSVGTYAPGHGRTVDESWPATGVSSSFYSRDKAAVEAQLDALERAHPGVRVVRMRPALIFRPTAGAEIRRLFLGTLIPRSVIRLLPVVPAVRGLTLQCVATDDVAAAFQTALHEPVRGAFNLAAEPVLSMDDVASAFHAKSIPMPAALLRTVVDLTWRARLQPTPAGWLDMALAAPTMNSARAHDELGWKPEIDAVTALVELVAGIKDDATDVTPPLRTDPRT